MSSSHRWKVGGIAMKRACFLAAVVFSSAFATAYDVREHYTKHEVMVPMRDGVKLFTILHEPKDRSLTYPFLLLRAPYSIPPYGVDEYREQLGKRRTPSTTRRPILHTSSCPSYVRDPGPPRTTFAPQSED